MKIAVLEKDIDEGIPVSPGHCPIALAVTRSLTLAIPAQVGSTSCTINKGATMRIVYDLPPEAVQFVKAFDDRKTVYPLQFELDENSGRYV